MCCGSPGGSPVVRRRGCRQRRVILNERSEVHSESRRQPAVFIVRSATDARDELPFRCCRSRANPWAGQSLTRGDDRRPGDALIDLPRSEAPEIRRAGVRLKRQKSAPPRTDSPKCPKRYSEVVPRPLKLPSPAESRSLYRAKLRRHHPVLCVAPGSCLAAPRSPALLEHALVGPDPRYGF